MKTNNLEQNIKSFLNKTVSSIEIDGITYSSSKVFPNKEFYTIREVCKKINVSEHLIKKAILLKQIKTKNIGGKEFISHENFKKFIES